MSDSPGDEPQQSSEEELVRARALARRLPGYLYTGVVALTALFFGVFLAPTDGSRYGSSAYGFIALMGLACITLPLALYMFHRSVFGTERSRMVAIASVVHALPGILALLAQIYRLFVE